MDMYQKRKKRKEMKSNENKEEMQKQMNINWYPGHMAKTKRLIKENLGVIDCIYEVIDSRTPYSSKIKDLDELVSSKPRILVMTKYDLCDKSETDKFIKYYESIGYYVFKCDLTSDMKLNGLFELSNKVLEDKFLKMKEKGLKRENIHVLVVGIPNVGKSTLINRIVGKKITITGNKPGVTKNLSWIRVGSNIDLLDSPGILWPKLDQEREAFNLASTTAIREEILPKEDVAFYIINFLHDYYPSVLEEVYGLLDVSSFYDVYETIGKRRGFVRRGGVIDDDRVTDLIINNIKQGKIKNITFDRFDDYEL